MGDDRRADVVSAGVDKGLNSSRKLQRRVNDEKLGSVTWVLT